MTFIYNEAKRRRAAARKRRKRRKRGVMAARRDRWRTVGLDYLPPF